MTVMLVNFETSARQSWLTCDWRLQHCEQHDEDLQQRPATDDYLDIEIRIQKLALHARSLSIRSPATL
jgi:hypothetical protein